MRSDKFGSHSDYEFISTSADAKVRASRTERVILSCALPIALIGALASGLVHAQTQFQDVTAAAGFTYTGESWGASWGDVNGDLLPDLFVNHHRAPPTLHINQGGLSFLDVTASTYWSDPSTVGDMHGGSWSDFDNDGDQDFYVTHGSKNENHFMVNEGGALVYRTSDYDPLIPSWRGRMPIWFDFTGDGLLDVHVTSENVSPTLAQVPPSFADRTAAAGTTCDKRQMGFLADVTGDGVLEFICSGASWPGTIYDFSGGLPFTQVTGLMPGVSYVQDVAIADFDNNLKVDFFAVRGKKRLSGADQVGSNSLVAQLVATGGGERSAKFDSNGDVTITLVTERDFSGDDVFIGSEGWNPDVPVTKVGGERTIVLSLSSSDPSVVGIAPHDTSTSRNVYIGYEPATETWTIANSPGGSWTYLYLAVDSTAPVSGVTESGINYLDRPILPALLSHGAGGISDVASTAGFKPVQCISVAAADFDNDMDVDLYVVCRDANLNIANRYYDNDGSGNFVEVPLAGGAAGPIGYGVGKGENVVAADYDADGNVDLFVTNGLAMNPQLVGGPDLLFRNLGNADNHWIELDLIGTVSNRDGIGARVLATAGSMTQLREQNGGYHRWAQHDKRLHFGLGLNVVVDLVIEWPSGVVDVHNGVAVNWVYQATEGGSLAPVSPGGSPTPAVSISPGALSVAEDAGSVSVDINLSVSDAAPISVNYSTVDGEALAPGDYVAGADTVVFAPGEVKKSVTVGIVDDAEPESVEAFTIDILGITGNAVLASSSAVVSILDDESTVGVPLVSWVGNTGGVTTSGNQINYSGMPTDWINNTVNSVAFSTLGIGGDFEVFWTIDSNPASTVWVVGLGEVESGPGRTDIDYGLRSSEGTLQIRENGAWRSNGPTLGIGDIISIKVHSTGLLEYRHNGVTVYGSVISGSPEFYVDTSFKQGAIALSVSVDDTGSPPGGGVIPITDWIGASGGVFVSADDISYPGSPTGWVNTVNSLPLSGLGGTGDFTVSWRVDSAVSSGQIWIVGLGVIETGSNWRDVEYGLRGSDGKIRVYENGVERVNGGPLEIGDVLSIRVAGSTLTYLLNGVTLHSSAITGTENFYIDSAFKAGAVDLVDFTLSTQ